MEPAPDASPQERLLAALGSRGVTPDEVRAVALSFDGATERDHHGFPSFRTTRRIFATMPDDGHLA